MHRQAESKLQLPYLAGVAAELAAIDRAGYLAPGLKNIGWWLRHCLSPPVRETKLLRLILR